MSITKLSPETKMSFQILLDEECGYATHFWYPEMSPAELIEWWKDMDDPWFFCVLVDRLPGTVVPCNSVRKRKAWRKQKREGRPHAHLHTKEDSYLCIGNVTYQWDDLGQQLEITNEVPDGSNS